MPPVPESASKAVKIWLQSVESGCELKHMNRVDRIAHQVTYPAPDFVRIEVCL
jgi:hypothetical protein